MKSDKRSDLSHDLPYLAGIAYKYYLKGLTGKEIGLLLKISSRTAQRMIRNYEFKKMATPKPVKDRCIELSRKGFSYTEIAKQMKVSKTTVYNHIRHMKERQLSAGNKYQPLFDFLSSELNVIPLESDMQEIERIVNTIQRKKET